jgi:hypothetical protein
MWNGANTRKPKIYIHKLRIKNEYNVQYSKEYINLISDVGEKPFTFLFIERRHHLYSLSLCFLHGNIKYVLSVVAIWLHVQRLPSLWKKPIPTITSSSPQLTSADTNSEPERKWYLGVPNLFATICIIQVHLWSSSKLLYNHRGRG